MCLSQLAGRIRVSLQSASESTGRLCSSQLAVCGRVCWQSQLESVPVGGSCPSPFKLAVCVRVSWQSVSEVGSGLRPASESADSLCLSQLAGCVRVSMRSGPEPAGNQCPIQLTVSDRISWQSVFESDGSLWCNQSAVGVRVGWHPGSGSVGSQYLASDVDCNLWSSQRVVCGRVSWQSKFESVQVGGPGPNPLAVCVRVSRLSVSEPVDSLSPSQLVVCSRVSWQSMSEPVKGGDPYPSQLAAVCNRVGSLSTSLAVTCVWHPNQLPACV